MSSTEFRKNLHIQEETGQKGNREGRTHTQRLKRNIDTNPGKGHKGIFTLFSQHFYVSTYIKTERIKR